MTKKKEKLLEKCHADFLDICFGDFPMNLVKTRVSEKIAGYGTYIKEKIQSINDFIEWLKNQREEPKGTEIKYQFGLVSKTILAEDNAAVYVDDIKLIMTIEGNKLELNIHLSTVFEFKNEEWLAVNFHGSLADGIEGERDIWAANEWKEKNEKLEKINKEKTEELRLSLENLKAVQDQLVQQEKLASLGQLTAGIAHEIKNPLNFVNNFSEVSLELVEEAREEMRRGTEEGGPESEKSEVKSEKENSPLSKGGRGGFSDIGKPMEVESNPDPSLLLDILDDIEANLKTILKHGSRADSIVKSMLQHSRGGSGEMEPADLNAIIREYVNLSFHAMRAGEDPINVDIDLQLDDEVGEVPLVAEDFSRVLINLCNNAFDAMREKQGAGHEAQGSGEYEPKLTVRTKSDSGKIAIEIEDNGPGIPEDMKDKILQPFFTTKKGTDGTGLGLSITNDIIKAHGGEISIESAENTGTTFVIKIPNDFKSPFSYG